MLWQALVTSVPLLALSAAIEGQPREAVSRVSSPWIAAAALAYAVLVSTLAANTAWTWLLKRRPASTAAPATMLVPVFGLSLAHLLFDEPLGCSSSVTEERQRATAGLAPQHLATIGALSGTPLVSPPAVAA